MKLSQDVNQDTRDKVSNLLNLSDVYLGDYLHLQVICTSNATVDRLDAALLRPGRLIGYRAFRRLTRAEAQTLASAKGLRLSEQKDYSLAEVYNGSSVSPALNEVRNFGFK